ncbi:beta family protein [Prevotella communis]|uniref:beta family protein n=1 Tax=Prevotella communis TaxID=2913614 RepID=UPI001EDB6B8D|nr:beta family protein [Prevotella communis]UKK56931.1 beta family protein [Prevotella communis]
MNKDYFLVIKTGQAEIRAIENTSRATLEKLYPVIELTRGRKRTLEDDTVIHPFESRLNKLKEALKGMDVAIDVTSDSALSCAEVDAMYEFENGYEKWVNFIKGIKDEGCFRIITPALMMNFDDPDYDNNLSAEITELSNYFDTLMYRDTIEADYCYNDLPFILEKLPKDKKLIILIDCGYTPQAMEENVSQRLLKRIENLKNSIIDKRCELAFCATSFPNNISEIGGLNYDEFRIAEVYMHEKVAARFPDVHYGDYGSINPKRNDNIIMARGWIPRIDVPLYKEVFYHRQRRVGAPYPDTYEKVAREVLKDPKYPYQLKCWGCSQIELCSTSAPAGSPNYWISVRMNIHIEQQLRRLKLIDTGK